MRGLLLPRVRGDTTSSATMARNATSILVARGGDPRPTTGRGPFTVLQSVERLRRRLQTEPTSVRDEVESLLPYLRTLDSRQGAGIADAAPGLLESIAREAW